jgi:VanZ family protein
MRRVLLIVSLAATVGAVFYFALAPNVRRDVLNVLPAPIRSWCGTNDDFSNFLLFAILAFITFRLRLGSARTKETSWRQFVGLLLLVVALEVAQIWIPGRYSSLRDVLTGSAGVCLVWLLTRFRNVGG